MEYTTLNRWVTRYSCAIAEAARRRKSPCDRSWRMDETYIEVKGAWIYLYRAVGKHGKILDFMLSRRRNKPAATKFFARMLEANRLQRKMTIDNSVTNTVGVETINIMLNGFGCPMPIEMVRRKNLNSIVEQDHRFILRRTRPMLGIKAVASAAALDGIEVAEVAVMVS